MKFLKLIGSHKRKLVLWFIYLLIAYAIFGFLILPPIVRVVAVKQLSKKLGRDVSIEKIKINPFVFSATIRGFLIKEKNGEPFVSWDEVYVNFQPTSVFGKAWTFKKISAAKPYIRVEINGDGKFNFADIIANSSANVASSKVASKPLAVRIERLQIDGARLNYESLLAAKNFTVRTNENSPILDPVAPTNPVSANILALRGVTNVMAMFFDSTNQLIGTLDDLETTNGAVHFEDRANSRPAKLDLSDITFEAKNISNLRVTNHTSKLSLRWNQSGSMKVETTASFLPPEIEIRFDFDRLDLGTLDPYLEPKLDLLILSSEAGLHGKINLRAPENQLPQITFNGDANLDDFRTVDGVMGEDLLKWDSLRIGGIDMNLNPETVVIKKIAVDNAYVRLVIETNKTINLLNALRMTKVPATNEMKIAAAKKPEVSKNEIAPVLPQISVGDIVVSNATIKFTDRSLEPDVNMAIEKANGTISGISSAQLQHANVNLYAVIDGVGPASITGIINPFSGALTNSIKISVKDVDLTPTGPYSGKFAGYSIAEGKLNLDLAYEVVGKKLDSKNVITLDQFTFGEQVNSPDATHLPVRLAIAILKDREGKIILDVPIQGSLDDPKFRIGKVVQRAIMNILEKVATSPFSLLGAAFGGGGEELSYEEFAAGSAELTADDLKKLDMLSKGLYERPGLNLEISGSVDPKGDREGLQRAMLDKEIRTQIWMKLRKSERATNSVDQIVLSPEARTRWVKKIYDKALADKKITPELLSANTNLAAYAAEVLPHKLKAEKGATELMQLSSSRNSKAAPTAYQTRLVPPPDPMEAVLFATFPVSENDLETLAAARAKMIQDYLLQSGKVQASRLFLTAKGAALRNDGSRVYLQFR